MELKLSQGERDNQHINIPMNNKIPGSNKYYRRKIKQRKGIESVWRRYSKLG